MSQTNYERIKNAKGDAYKILNLDREATADEVKAACLSLFRLFAGHFGLILAVL